MAYDYDLLHVTVAGGVARVVIDNPPINLMTVPLFLQLAGVAAELAADDSARVVVLESAVADFFIAHFDVEAILGFPTDEPAREEPELNAFHVMCETFRTMPKPTLVKAAGRVGGGGAELAASCDMRFGALGHTVLNQMEVALGILPGGSGTQRLPRLLGRGRALEVVLGSDDIDAATLERWGWLNRALPPHDLDGFVDRLARRMATFPPEAVAWAKQAVLAAEPDPAPGLRTEAYLFQQTLRTEPAQRTMRWFLENGGQTREGELAVGQLCGRLGDVPEG